VAVYHVKKKLRIYRLELQELFCLYALFSCLGYVVLVTFGNWNGMLRPEFFFVGPFQPGPFTHSPPKCIFLNNFSLYTWQHNIAILFFFRNPALFLGKNLPLSLYNVIITKISYN